MTVPYVPKSAIEGGRLTWHEVLTWLADLATSVEVYQLMIMQLTGEMATIGIFVTEKRSYGVLADLFRSPEAETSEVAQPGQAREPLPELAQRPATFSCLLDAGWGLTVTLVER
jgi:hypothetical protein